MNDIAVPVDADPKWIMLGFEKPGGRGVMIYACRTFPRAPTWGGEQGKLSEPIWVLNAGLTQLLRVDDVDWNHAMAQIFQRWANEDAETGRRQALAANRIIGERRELLDQAEHHDELGGV